MLGIYSNKRKKEGTALSLSYYNEKQNKSYEVCYESCAMNEYAHVKMLDEYRDKMPTRFKHWIPNERLDSLVGHALRNGFFSLKPLYQGDVYNRKGKDCGLGIVEHHIHHRIVGQALIQRHK